MTTSSDATTSSETPAETEPPGRKSGGGGQAAPQRLQDAYLAQAQADKTQLAVFLVNGVKLLGSVAGYDAFCLLLERDGKSQLIYKGTISTITPLEPMAIETGDEATSRDVGAPKAGPRAAVKPSRAPVVERRRLGR